MGRRRAIDDAYHEQTKAIKTERSRKISLGRSGQRGGINKVELMRTETRNRPCADGGILKSRVSEGTN